MGDITLNTRAGYSTDRTQAALAVLVEVMHVLGAYRDDLVLVGGWAPPLLVPGGLQTHCGSLDIDLVVDHRAIQEAERCATMLALLLRAGYARDPMQPFVFRRPPIRPGGIAVEVDLLAGEYGGASPSHRHQRIEDVRVRKARGADLALLSWVDVTLSGVLPDGTDDTVRLRVASPAALLVMKAEALEHRPMPKDAYDIAYCLRESPGGVEGVSESFRPILSHGLVREALGILRERYATVQSTGPRLAARFEDPASAEESAVLARDAFERMAAPLRLLGAT